MKEVSDARKALIGAKGLEKKVKADGALEGALGKLFAIAENYPQLKADQNFLELQKIYGIMQPVSVETPMSDQEVKNT